VIHALKLSVSRPVVARSFRPARRHPVLTPISRESNQFTAGMEVTAMVDGIRSSAIRIRLRTITSLNPTDSRIKPIAIGTMTEVSHNANGRQCANIENLPAAKYIGAEGEQEHAQQKDRREHVRYYLAGDPWKA
jgi:hypothetical protein